MELKLKQVIKRELKARGQSINSLAEATNIPVSTLHNWSQGALPNGKNLHLVNVLADYFKMSLSTLLFNKSDKNVESTILFTSMFVDEKRRYRLIIEKLEGEE